MRLFNPIENYFNEIKSFSAVLNNDGTVFDKSRIPIGDRVRDLLFDINEEKIYLFLENSGSIAILTKK